MTTEQRVIAIENELRARKAQYPISGSLVKMECQSTSVMLYQKGNNDLAKVRIKFTPSNTNGYTLATLYAEVYELYGASRWIYPRATSILQPQSGDGSVIIEVSISTHYDPFDYEVKVTSFSPSPGTFAIL